ncbi:MAG: PEP-CTERM sorting domain-containing protein [Phycisphaerales bacterium]|nr:PEP-CTERM sorting domain-containing protein [Phycisphaerales bacterium]
MNTTTLLAHLGALTLVSVSWARTNYSTLDAGIFEHSNQDGPVRSLSPGDPLIDLEDRGGAPKWMPGLMIEHPTLQTGGGVNAGSALSQDWGLPLDEGLPFSERPSVDLGQALELSLSPQWHPPQHVGLPEGARGPQDAPWDSQTPLNPNWRPLELPGFCLPDTGALGQRKLEHGAVPAPGALPLLGLVAMGMRGRRRRA